MTATVAAHLFVGCSIDASSSSSHLYLAYLGLMKYRYRGPAKEDGRAATTAVMNVNVEARQDDSRSTSASWPRISEGRLQGTSDRGPSPC
jgi:hypothetical protein